MAHPVFYLLAFIIISSAFMVVALKNIFHSALFLILTLFAVAGIYLLLQAEFLAAVQVLIYVGAVSVLIIFAIMLTTKIASPEREQSNRQSAVAAFICVAFLIVSLGSIAKKITFWPVVDRPLPEHNTLALGKLLMNEYVLPFEIVSVVLLAALIGAVVLARKEDV